MAKVKVPTSQTAKTPKQTPAPNKTPFMSRTRG